MSPTQIVKTLYFMENLVIVDVVEGKGRGMSSWHAQSSQIPG